MIEFLLFIILSAEEKLKHRNQFSFKNFKFINLKIQLHFY